MHNKADILDDYRQWQVGLPLRIGTHSDRCHLWHEKCMIHRLAKALEDARQDLSQKNHCPDLEKAPNEDNYLAEIDRMKATITSLAGDRDLYKNLARQFGEDATRAKKRIEELESGLTDEERGAVERAADALSGVDDWSPDESEKDNLAVATLRGLLSRTGTDGEKTVEDAAECTDKDWKTPEREHKNG